MRLSISLPFFRRPFFRRISEFGTPSFRAGLPRAFSVVLALALAVTVTERVLVSISGRVPPEPVQAVALGDGASRTQAADIAPIAALLGDQAGNNASQVRLLGVIAQGTRGRGLAIVSIDGQPARTVRAGAVLGADVILTEVRADHVLVNRAGTVQEVRLPPKKALPSGIQPVLPDRGATHPAAPAETSIPGPGGKLSPAASR